MRPSAVFLASNRRTPVRVEVERLFVQPLSADATVIRSILPNCERCPHSTPPVPEILKDANKTFREIPHTVDGRRVTSYAARGGLRVDFLTPQRRWGNRTAPGAARTANRRPTVALS